MMPTLDLCVHLNKSENTNTQNLCYIQNIFNKGNLLSASGMVLPRGTQFTIHLPIYVVMWLEQLYPIKLCLADHPQPLEAEQ